MAAAESFDDAAGCAVCFNPFDTEERKPWDLGCGHSFCEECLRDNPRSFRTCPECRTRARTPHVNIALLRTLRPPPPRPSAPPAGGGGSGSGVLTRRQRQQLERQQQQPPQQQQPARASPADLIAGAARFGDAHNPLAAAVALAATVQAALHRRGPGPPLHGPEVVAWKATIWSWLGPVLALLYIISPLDVIPDFLPLIGWVDDLLALGYLAACLYRRAAAARA